MVKYYKLPTHGIDWTQENHMVPNILLFESIMEHWRLDPLVLLHNSIMLHLDIFTLHIQSINFHPIPSRYRQLPIAITAIRAQSIRIFQFTSSYLIRQRFEQLITSFAA